MNDQARYESEGLRYPKFKRHFSEFIGIGDNGHLWVEGCDVVALADAYGTPLYVISEGQLRHNYRRFRDAFASRYAESVDILFANKSNNALAVRHILNQEGAGGDAFGLQEMYLALLTGTNAKKLVLNGSNKEPAEIEMAVLNGVCINIDAMDELDLIDETANRLKREVDVGIRTKLELKPLENRFGAELHGPGSLAEQGRNHKWGMPFSQTVELVKRIQKMPHLHLIELSYHLSRMDNDADDFAVMAREMVQWAALLRDATGWSPRYLDLGGGWTFGRPEKCGPGGADDESTPPFEEYAEAVCGAVSAECEARGLTLPGLKIEPGRSIAGNCGVAVGRVGALKEWPEYDKKWVNVDLSTNHIPAAAANWYFHILSANKAEAPPAQIADIVGPLCTIDLLGEAREIPKLVRGDLIALIDTGAYSESRAANFNAQLRPATVLVAGAEAEVTTERERLSDVVGRFRAPARLLAESFAAR